MALQERQREVRGVAVPPNPSGEGLRWTQVADWVGSSADAGRQEVTGKVSGQDFTKQGHMEIKLGKYYRLSFYNRKKEQMYPVEVRAWFQNCTASNSPGSYTSPGFETIPVIRAVGPVISYVQLLTPADITVLGDDRKLGLLSFTARFDPGTPLTEKIQGTNQSVVSARVDICTNPGRVPTYMPVHAPPQRGGATLTDGIAPPARNNPLTIGNDRTRNNNINNNNNGTNNNNNAAPPPPPPPPPVPAPARVPAPVPVPAPAPQRVTLDLDE